MNVFGYIKRRCNSEGLVELSQVTFQSSPDTLREIASFLLSAAAEMEAGGPTFDHRHIQDEVKGWRSRTPELPDVIVAS